LLSTHRLQVVCASLAAVADRFVVFYNLSSLPAIFTLSLHDALPIFITNVRSSLMAVNIHITIIELNALHTKRQNLFVCRALSSIDRKSGSAGMPRPISYAVFCLKKKNNSDETKTRYEQTTQLTTCTT